MIIKWFYHLIKFQKLSAESFGLLTHALGFWEGSYKKKRFWALQGEDFFREKSNSWENKKNQRKTYCRANFWKKSLLSSFLKLIRTKQRSKKGLFSSIFLLNIAFKPHKRQRSQFPRQNYKSKRWKPSEGENQYCINISFLLLSLLFLIILFNLLFDSIYFFILLIILYILIILLFFIFWWVDWCE